MLHAARMALCCLLLSSVAFAQEPKKYALLVAVTTYEHAHLNQPPKIQYPEADAQAIGAVLKAGGYEVDLLLGEQATAKGIETALSGLARKGNQPGVVVLGFFGHGVEYDEKDADGKPTSRSYFCPYDCTMRKRLDNGRDSFDKQGKLRIEPDPAGLVSMSRVFEALSLSPAGNRVLLADCCRDDPHAARAAGRGFGTGIKTGDLPENANTAALFACSKGEQALEDRTSGHGVFTKCVLDWLRNPQGRVTANELALHVDEAVPELVTSLTEGRQRQQPKFLNAGKVALQLESAGKPALLIAPFNAAAAQAGQAAWAKFLGKPIIEKTGIGLELTLIPPGEFTMGSPLTEAEWSEDETQHRVRLTKPFRLGVHEVTQAEYKAVTGSEPSWFSAGGGGKSSVSGIDTSRFPVENVSWYDAVEFCNKLSSREGLLAYYELTDIERKEGSISSATVREKNNGGYRLPTEAEWEYACRAGTTSAFHFGDVNNGQEANIDGNSPYGTATKGPSKQRTTAVESYAANGFGLRDMHGNVYEWCGDWYDAEFYGKSNGTTVDPFSASSGDFRVLRGGSWGSDARFTRAAPRSRYSPGFRDSFTGFRVSRTP